MTRNGATSVWSGYNHQGRVGLFVALSEATKLVEANNGLTPDQLNSLLSDWQLRFELKEDFEIVQKSTNKVHSRHQVKAYFKGTAQSRYSSVFAKRKKKNSKGKVVKDTQGKTVWVDGFKCDGVDEASRYLHVICQIDITGWDINGYKVQLYKYPAIGANPRKPYCEFSAVSSIEDELMTFAVDAIEKLSGRSRLECIMAWKGMQHTLQMRISSAHVNKDCAVIDFHELLAISTTESDVTNFVADNLCQEINEYYDDYIAARDDVADFTDDMRIRLAKYVQDLNALNPDDLLKTVRYLHVDESKNHNVSKVGLKQVVYEVLSKAEKFDYDKSLIKYTVDGDYYVLTTITELSPREDENSKGTNKVEAQKIMKSLEEEDVALTFASSKIINQSLSAPFQSLTPSTVGVETAILVGEKLYDITTPAPLNFISVIDTIDELKEG